MSADVNEGIDYVIAEFSREDTRFDSIDKIKFDHILGFDSQTRVFHQNGS